jgi:hypothetical protein
MKIIDRLIHKKVIIKDNMYKIIAGIDADVYEKLEDALFISMSRTLTAVNLAFQITKLK